jgi:hypothetical protein
VTPFEIENQIAETERSIAEIDAILECLPPEEAHFRPSLEGCRNAVVTLISLMPHIEEWPAVIW